MGFMDIALLSKIVKELILDRDEISLPGLGTFVTELAPAYFSDRGYTINPPYRRLSFRHKESPQDTSLADFYAAGNNIDKATAARIIEDFIRELRRTLESRKTVVLPGLGKLRATRENHFFFIADENLDIYPEGFGLEPISLKTHQETAEEVSESIKHLSEILEPELSAPATKAAETMTEVAETSGNEAETAAEDASTDDSRDAAAPAVSDGAAVSGGSDVAGSSAPAGNSPQGVAVQRHRDSLPHRTRRHRSKTRSGCVLGLKIAAAAAALAVLALAVFLLLAHTAPDFIDSILYSPEELRIIHYDL